MVQSNLGKQHSLTVRLAENCFRSGIPEEETVKRTYFHNYLRQIETVIRQNTYCTVMYNQYGLRQPDSQVGTGRCLANAAFLVGNGDDLRVH